MLSNRKKMQVMCSDFLCSAFLRFLILGFVLKNGRFYLQTSTHFSYPETSSSSAIESFTALWSFPAAGYSVSYCFSDSSRYTGIPDRIPNGQTPPGACPIRRSTSSNGIIFALIWNVSLNLWLSMRAVPIVRIRIGCSPIRKDIVLAIIPGSTPRASAASWTVALESASSMIWSAYPFSCK